MNEEQRYYLLGQSLKATLLGPLRMGVRQRLEVHIQVAKLEWEREEVFFLQ